MASANSRGSFSIREFGLPWATSQKGQRRVQISPMIIKVAVPPLKHSPKLGQEASSQTELSLCFLRVARIFSTFSLFPRETRIQSGLRGISTVGITLMGMRATLSAPRSFSPCTTFLGTDLVSSFMFSISAMIYLLDKKGIITDCQRAH